MTVAKNPGGGIPGPRAERVAQYFSTLPPGTTVNCAKVASALGDVSRVTVWNTLNAAIIAGADLQKLPQGKEQVHAARDERLAAEWTGGKTGPEVAVENGLTPSAAYSALYRQRAETPYSVPRRQLPDKARADVTTALIGYWETGVTVANIVSALKADFSPVALLITNGAVRRIIDDLLAKGREEGATPIIEPRRSMRK